MRNHRHITTRTRRTAPKPQRVADTYFNTIDELGSRLMLGEELTPEETTDLLHALAFEVVRLGSTEREARALAREETSHVGHR